MKSKFIKAFILFLMLALIMVPAVDAQSDTGETVDIIILAEGYVDALIDSIVSWGGVVNFQYDNVSAVAATIPVEKLGAVSALRGVTSVQKDDLVYLTIDDTFHPLSHTVEEIAGVEVQAVDPSTIDSEVLPEGYANFIYTGSFGLWTETKAGSGTIVAVVDTGTVPTTCLSHAVIGAPGYPEGYNAIPDGIPATSPDNYWHGTHVGGVIASACSLDFTSDPTHPIYLAQQPFLGWPVDFVPIFGQAPSAQIYPVKVFPTDGSGVPTSVILDGLDHVLTLKKDGILDIDIVNMSLGGPTLWDGRDAYDRFIEELQAANMLVVTSAGNAGPVPNSVGSPGTSFGALSVGGLDYALSSRTFYEYLGLAIWPGAPGQGLIMRPTEETRVVNYSSRGPLSDGRFGPEITALGHWNFHEGPQGELRWAGGTSFASPTVAGGAALLNAWWEDQGHETDPKILENVLLLGADPEVVGEAWQNINDQGYGALDVPASLDKLQAGDWEFEHPMTLGKLPTPVLGYPWYRRNHTWESKSIELDPSETFDAVFAVNQFTSKVTIQIYDIVTPDNYDYAYWANALEVHVQSAKRSSFDHPIAVLWDPNGLGDSIEIVIEDGSWTFAGLPWDYIPMEPGLMKLSLLPDYSNESPVSFKVRITRENNRRPLSYWNRIGSGFIKMADSTIYEVEIPQGTTKATFDLTWYRDWSKFPTSDIDMVIYDPTLLLASIDGATANAPERAVIENPMAGTWYVVVDGYEVNRMDYYSLYLTLE